MVSAYEAYDLFRQMASSLSETGKTLIIEQKKLCLLSKSLGVCQQVLQAF